MVSLSLGGLMAYLNPAISTIPDPAPRSSPRASPSRSATGGHIPSWLAEKSNFHTYCHLLSENFDLLKLSLVLLFILHGLFCAKYYNFANTLEGNLELMQFLHGINLIFHEAGHILFMPFGRFMKILGGSLNQILIPAIVSSYFFFKGQSILVPRIFLVRLLRFRVWVVIAILPANQLYRLSAFDYRGTDDRRGQSHVLK
jgi:hypothetical protein